METRGERARCQGRSGIGRLSFIIPVKRCATQPLEPQIYAILRRECRCSDTEAVDFRGCCGERGGRRCGRFVRPAGDRVRGEFKGGERGTAQRWRIPFSYGTNNTISPLQQPTISAQPTKAQWVCKW